MPIAPRSLFAGLVDDAALFPPGNAPMEVGVREHVQHHTSSYAVFVGPFVCPASRVAELRAALPSDAHLQLSLVVDVAGEATHAALRAVQAEPRLTLVAVEAPAARLGDDAATVGANLRRLPGVVGYLEVPSTGWEPALDLVSDGGWHAAKYRTGGQHAAAVPTPSQLAGFLADCVRRGVAFKLTAGLHHAVAAMDGGAQQHGVLNVMAAVAAAQSGASEEQLSDIVATPAGDELSAEVAQWSDDRCRHVRGAFRSFGCCGVTDPISDLAALGLIEEPQS